MSDIDRPAACPNCATPLVGPWCHTCGQKAHVHRTLAAVMHEVVESVTHADGRFWSTMRDLAIRPGRLTRDWIEGRRARHVPPMHLFLFAMLLLFLLMGATDAHMTPLVTDAAGMGSEWRPIAEKIAANPELSRYKIDVWAYKLTFLAVPLAMLAVGLLLVFRRGHSFYDHAAFALNQMAFLGFCSALLAVIGALSQSTLALLMPMLLVIHGSVHFRGAYRLSWIGAIVRATLLTGFAMVIFGLFFYAAIYVAMLI